MSTTPLPAHSLDSDVTIEDVDKLLTRYYKDIKRNKSTYIVQEAREWIDILLDIRLDLMEGGT